jgi:hypothetical protein
MEPEFHQSNDEAVLVDLIQSARAEAEALIINPAAYSFTSIAMYDAMKVFEGPIFEVHISNIHARDQLDRHSKLSSAVTAVIAGLGPFVAMQAALHKLGKLPGTVPTAVRVARSGTVYSKRPLRAASSRLRIQMGSAVPAKCRDHILCELSQVSMSFLT